MTLRFSLAVAMLGLMFSEASNAAPPHVHGVANLNMSVDGTALQISLEAPLDNLLGFEHRPSTPAQVDETRLMARTLRHAESVFVLAPQAACKLIEVTLESSVIEPSLLSGDKGKSADQGAAATNHAPDASPLAPSGHADLDADFRFNCAHPELLRGMEVKLFQAFPIFRALKVQVVTPRRQSATTLTPTATSVTW